MLTRNVCVCVCEREPSDRELFYVIQHHLAIAQGKIRFQCQILKLHVAQKLTIQILHNLDVNKSIRPSKIFSLKDMISGKKEKSIVLQSSISLIGGDVDVPKWIYGAHYYSRLIFMQTVLIKAVPVSSPWLRKTLSSQRGSDMLICNYIRALLLSRWLIQAVI